MRVEDCSNCGGRLADPARSPERYWYCFNCRIGWRIDPHSLRCEYIVVRPPPAAAGRSGVESRAVGGAARPTRGPWSSTPRGGPRPARSVRPAAGQHVVVGEPLVHAPHQVAAAEDHVAQAVLLEAPTGNV